MCVPGLRQLGPAPAHVHPRELQAPQQGRGVHQVQHHGAGRLAHAAVVEREHGVGLAQFQVAERPVPGVVHLEEVVIARPVRLARGHPADAVLRAALHFHHVRHGVVRPAVQRLRIERLASHRFGARVVATFFEAERVHAQDDGMPRHVGGPVRHHARDAVAQVARAGAVEVDQVPGLQRHDVIRVLHVVPVHGQGGLGPFALQHALDHRDVRGLAFVHGQ
ncbi:hypothetical protein FQZ97_973220 [compost metagenome]